MAETTSGTPDLWADCPTAQRESLNLPPAAYGP